MIMASSSCEPTAYRLRLFASLFGLVCGDRAWLAVAASGRGLPLGDERFALSVGIVVGVGVGIAFGIVVVVVVVVVVVASRRDAGLSAAAAPPRLLHRRRRRPRGFADIGPGPPPTLYGSGHVYDFEVCVHVHAYDFHSITLEICKQQSSCGALVARLVVEVAGVCRSVVIMRHAGSVQKSAALGGWGEVRHERFPKCILRQ